MTGSTLSGTGCYRLYPHGTSGRQRVKSTSNEGRQFGSWGVTSPGRSVGRELMSDWWSGTGRWLVRSLGVMLGAVRRWAHHQSTPTIMRWSSLTHDRPAESVVCQTKAMS